jgi:hypothetical protein
MLHRRLAATAGFIFFFAAAGAHAQQGHAIRGKVRDAAGNGLPRVIVDLQTGTGLSTEQTTTDIPSSRHNYDLFPSENRPVRRIRRGDSPASFPLTVRAPVSASGRTTSGFGSLCRPAA